MKIKTITGMVLGLLILPALVLALTSSEGSEVASEIFVWNETNGTLKEDTGIIHHYPDLSSMPSFTDSNNLTRGECESIADCSGKVKWFSETKCIGDFRYQTIITPRCMIDKDASTPARCMYRPQDIVIGNC